jgi:hypothetical protein
MTWSLRRDDVEVVWRKSLNGGFGQTITHPRQIFAYLIIYGMKIADARVSDG